MVSFWDLNTPERRCLGQLYMAEPFNNMPHVGRKSLERLIELGLVEESPDTPFEADMHYRRTAEGEQVHDEMLKANRVPR